MKPVVAITRPDGPAQEFAATLGRLCDDGFDTVFSPAYRIAFLQSVEPIADFDHLIFTSVNGVKAAQKLKLNCEGKAWCVGDATAKAANGFGYNAISAKGDSESLLELVRRQYKEGKLLHVSGRETHLDFSVALSSDKIPCSRLVGYEQVALPAKEALKDVLMGSGDVVLPLFSTRAAMLLNGLEVSAPLHIVAISNAVVEGVSKNAEANYIIADEPNRASMAAATCEVLTSLQNPKRSQSDYGPEN